MLSTMWIDWTNTLPMGVKTKNLKRIHHFKVTIKGRVWRQRIVLGNMSVSLAYGSVEH